MFYGHPHYQGGRTGPQLSVTYNPCDPQGIDKTSINYPPILCGLGTGQHMYLNAYPGKNLDASVAITIGSASSQGRRWSIRVTQIDCGTLYTAPPACLQYHTGKHHATMLAMLTITMPGTTGSVQTWNYEDTNNIHTNNQNYAICIRREKGFCGTAYVADEASNRSSIGLVPSFKNMFLTVLVLTAPIHKGGGELSADWTL